MDRRMSRSGVMVTLVMAAALAFSAVGGASSSSAATPCPNESIRVAQDATGLPGCRAYELVSPASAPSLGGNDVIAFTPAVAPDGDSLGYFSRYSAETVTSASLWWKATRGASGWSVEASDPQGTTEPTVASCAFGNTFSEDLGTTLLAAGWSYAGEEWTIAGNKVPPGGTGEPGRCGMPLDELVPGEARGQGNLYLRGPGGGWQLVNPTPPGVTPGNASFQGASSDLSHVVFGEEAPLTPEAPAGFDLYEWVEGTVQLVGVLPDGTPVPAVLAGGISHRVEPPSEEEESGTSGSSFMHSVSEDGERVVFVAEGKLYLRENAGRQASGGECGRVGAGLGCTVEVDRSHGVGEDGGGSFQYASTEGSRIFFSDENKLTVPSSAVDGKPDLYEYDVGTGTLTDLTYDPTEPANVRGFAGASEDGSYIYFVGRGALTGGQPNAEGAVASPREPNLYVAHEGSLTFVATLSPWVEGPFYGGQKGGLDRDDFRQTNPKGGIAANTSFESRTSPDGRFILFPSYAELTGFDSRPAASGGCSGSLTCQELFVYDASSSALTCVSCRPGSPPIANTENSGRLQLTQYPSVLGQGVLEQQVTNEGQIFFQTANPLVPADTDDSTDVYEYVGGLPDLISGGSEPGGNSLLGATPDGSNIFFGTAATLAPSDSPGVSVYDARVDGGFVESAELRSCGSAEGCGRSPAAAPETAPSATSSFIGPDNAKPAPSRCRAPKVKRKGRCVKRPHKHKATKKHHRHEQKAKTKKKAGHGGGKR